MEFLLFSGVLLALVPGVVCEYKFTYGGMVVASIFAVLFLLAAIIMWMVVGLWHSYYEKLQLQQGRVRVPRTPRQKRKKVRAYDTVSTHNSNWQHIPMNELTPRGERKADIWAQNIPINRYEEKFKSIDLGEEEDVRIVEDVRVGHGHTPVPAGGERATYVVQTGDTSARHEYNTHRPVTMRQQTTSYIVQGNDVTADHSASGHHVMSGGERTYVVQSSTAAGGTPDYRATYHEGVSADDHTRYVNFQTEGKRETYAGPTSHPTSTGAYHVHAGRISGRGEVDDITSSPSMSPLAGTAVRADTGTGGEAVIVFGDEDNEVEVLNNLGDVNVKEGDMVLL